MRTASVILAVAGALAFLSAAAPAKADRDDWRHHEWREHERYEHPGWRPGYYAPPPVVVSPPAYSYYTPPPAYYAPGPGVSLGVTIR